MEDINTVVGELPDQKPVETIIIELMIDNRTIIKLFKNIIGCYKRDDKK